MGFKWLHFVLLEYILKKTVTALMFHEYHLLFQNCPMLRIFRIVVHLIMTA